MQEKSVYRVFSSYLNNLGSRLLGSYPVSKLPSVPGALARLNLCFLLQKWLVLGHSLETFPEQLAAVRDAGHEMYVYQFIVFGNGPYIPSSHF